MILAKFGYKKCKNWPRNPRFSRKTRIFFLKFKTGPTRASRAFLIFGPSRARAKSPKFRARALARSTTKKIRKLRRFQIPFFQTSVGKSHREKLRENQVNESINGSRILQTIPPNQAGLVITNHDGKRNLRIFELLRAFLKLYYSEQDFGSNGRRPISVHQALQDAREQTSNLQERFSSVTTKEMEQAMKQEFPEAEQRRTRSGRSANYFIGPRDNLPEGVSTFFPCSLMSVASTMVPHGIRQVFSELGRVPTLSRHIHPTPSP